MREETLVRMAHEIARNLRAEHGNDTAAATAEHLRSFWSPSMRQALTHLVDTDAHVVDAVVRQATDLLRASP